MNKSSSDSEDKVRDESEEKKPGEPAPEAARPAAGKRRGWLRFSRVREPGVRPKGFSVWLGRLRRKRG